MSESNLKCEEAVKLGKLRWKGKSESEIKEHMEMMALKSAKARTEKAQEMRGELKILIE